MSRIALPVAVIFLMVCSIARGQQQPAQSQWVVYEPPAELKDGPGKGKHIVLVGGDEEYRSEESLPQLGKILSQRHGFKCTVLFAIDPKTGEINPDITNNIPGLEALDSADLMIIQTRFRDLPDDQMKHIVDYLDTGKPIIGLRTATHAFNFPKGGTYAKYGWNYTGQDYAKGFGKQILGETWVQHWGKHGVQSTRGMFAPNMAGHAILRGIKDDGSIWGPTDVYEVTRPLPGDSQPIVLGQVLDGMTKDAKAADSDKNKPMMPVAWTKTYEGKNGKKGRVFTTTMGAATDLEAEGTRRMIVNAVYWALGMDEQIPDGGTDVTLVGEYKPTKFGFHGFKKGVKPVEHKL